MPRRTGNAALTKSVELIKQDQLEFDDPDEVDEEEEVEYEEIEEEVEYEEVEDDDDNEEEGEEEEDEEDEEEEEEDEEIEGVREVDANHDSKMVVDDLKDENEKGKHTELLALPPHGAEVYVGGLSSDVSSEDLKRLFESVGEVVEVSTAYFLWISFCISFLLQFRVPFFCRCECEERGITRRMLLLISELKRWL
jgi:heterogeneous nuclear ribonucleoprotein R